MSVASKNLFALLDDDASDVQIDTAPKKTTEVPKPQEESSLQNKSQRSKGGPASRGGRYYQRGGGAKPAPTPGDNVDESAQSENRRRGEGDTRGRGRGGRGGGRGGRGGGGPRRGREFDRQSGTLPDSDKRVHQGWGGDDGDRELQNEQAAEADVKAEATNNDWGASASATAGANDWAADASAAPANDWAAETTNPQEEDWAAPAGDANAAATPSANKEGGERSEFRSRRKEEEEDDNTLTLDQYMAQQKEKELALLPKLDSTRKPNEGSDDSLWKGVIQKEKSDEESNYFVGKMKAAPKARAKKAEKEIIDIDVHFERPARGGGRGRGRGSDSNDRRGGGRGRGRGGSDRTPLRSYNNGGGQRGGVDVDDQSAFPSLS